MSHPRALKAMEIVYTPWRLPYVQAKPTEGCVFCAAQEAPPSFDNLVVYSDEDLLIMLNRFPYTNGHMLVVPRPHVSSMTGLEERHRCASVRALTLCEVLLRDIFHAHGVNVGLNLGQAAGAGIIDHLHWHVLPRWIGDTNFCTVISELRVIPEDLKATYDRLAAGFAGKKL